MLSSSSEMDCEFPTVSIIIPNLNKGEFLSECLDSIRQQTLFSTNPHYEILFVDGYSEDGSWEFAKHFWKDDPHVHLFQRERFGLYDAWNWGIRKARGKYVYIATSDDLIYRQCLEKSINMLEINQKIDLAAFPVDLIDKDSKIIEGLYESHPGVRFFETVNRHLHIRPGLSFLLLHFVFVTLITSITGVLIRRSLFEKAGLFSEDLGSSGDREWIMRACIHTDVLWIPEVLATLRIHEDQATKKTTWEESQRYRSISDRRMKRRVELKYPEFTSAIRSVAHLLKPPAYEIDRSFLLGRNGCCHRKMLGIAKFVIAYPLISIQELTAWLRGDRFPYKEKLRRGQLILDKLGINAYRIC